jgi:hypothetical protein
MEIVMTGKHLTALTPEEQAILAPLFERIKAAHGIAASPEAGVFEKVDYTSEIAKACMGAFATELG